MRGESTCEDNPQRVDLMVKELEKQKEARLSFRRHRTPDLDERALHVSEKNRQFNERLQKHYGAHVQDIANRDTKPAI